MRIPTSHPKERLHKMTSAKPRPVEKTGPLPVKPPDALWQEDPQIYRILRESETLEVARQTLYGYLKDLEWRVRSRAADNDQLECATAMEAMRVFGNLLSARNEKLAGVSTLEPLWRLAQGAGDGVVLDDVPEAGLVDVGDVDDHAEPVHLLDDGGAELRQVGARVGP